MKTAAAILTLVLICGCMNWTREAEALRETHGRAVDAAAATNQFDAIPPMEAAR